MGNLGDGASVPGYWPVLVASACVAASLVLIDFQGRVKRFQQYRLAATFAEGRQGVVQRKVVLPIVKGLLPTITSTAVK